jgi:WD40 repeat protein/Tfp pilus assembly protein PilF
MASKLCQMVVWSFLLLAISDKTLAAGEMRRFAIIIGCNVYSDVAAFPKLTNAVADANGIYEALTGEFGYSASTTRRLVETPTKGQVQAAFKQWLTSLKPTATDSLLVFVAGHGFLHRDKGYIALSGSRRTSEATLGDTCLSVDELRRLVRQSGCSQAIIFLDTCYSGTLFEFEDQQPRATLSTPSASADVPNRGDAIVTEIVAPKLTDVVQQLKSHPCTIGVSAGRFGPVSDGTSGHSPFTKALLRHLRQRADSPFPSHAFSHEQICVRVKEDVTFGEKGHQIPQWGPLQGSGSGEFWFEPTLPDERQTPREQLHRNQIGRLVRFGNDAVDQRQLDVAATWFMRALDRDRRGGDFALSHRRRISTVLSQCARPKAVWRHHSNVIAALHSPTRDAAAVATTDGYIYCWSTDSLELLWKTMEPSPPTAMSYSASGAEILVGHGDGSVSVLRYTDGKRARTITTGKANVRSLQSSHNDERLLVTSGSQAFLVDFATGVVIGGAIELPDPTANAVLDRNGVFVAAYSDTGQVALFDYRTHQNAIKAIRKNSPTSLRDAPKLSPKVTQTMADDSVGAIAIRSDYMLAVGLRDGQVQFWSPDAQKLPMAPIVRGPAQKADGLRFSSNGNSLGIYDSDSGNYVYQWNATAYVDVTDTLTSLAATTPFPQYRDGTQRLLIVADGHIVALWDYAAFGAPATEIRAGTQLGGAVYNRDGSLIFGIRDGSRGPSAPEIALRGLSLHGQADLIWSSTTGLPYSLRSLTTEQIYLSADGTRLAAVDGNRRHVDVYKVGNPARLSRVPIEGELEFLRFSGDGSRLLLGTGSVLQVANIDQSLIPIKKWPGPIPAQFASFLTREGRSIVQARYEGPLSDVHASLCLWDVDSERIRWSVPGASLPMAISPTDQHVALSDGMSAVIFRLADGKQQSKTMAHTGTISAMAFSSDGTRVATAGMDRNVILSDVTTGKPIVKRFGNYEDGLRDSQYVALTHSGTVTSVCWSADDKWIATTDEQYGAQVFDTSMGEPVTPRLRHAGKVVHAAFGPESRTLLTTDATGVIREWNIGLAHESDDELKKAVKLFSGLDWEEDERQDEPAKLDRDVMDRYWHEARARHSEWLVCSPSQEKRWHREAAAQAKRLGLWLLAARQYEKLDQLEPHNPTWCEEGAVSYNNEGEFDKAASAFTKALKGNPKSAKLLNGRAFAFKELERFDEALTDANAACNVDPGNAYCVALRANIYQYANRYTEAIEQYKAAMLLSPSAELAKNIGNGLDYCQQKIGKARK